MARSARPKKRKRRKPQPEMSMTPTIWSLRKEKPSAAVRALKRPISIFGKKSEEPQ